jgi:hypothetical protein
LTNSVYQLADIWVMTDTMAAYCMALHAKIDQVNQVNSAIRRLKSVHETLKQCDYSREQGWAEKVKVKLREATQQI